jgi:esterase/lipase
MAKKKNINPLKANRWFKRTAPLLSWTVICLLLLVSASAFADVEEPSLASNRDDMGAICVELDHVIPVEDLWLEELVQQNIFPLNGDRNPPSYEKNREQIMRELQATEHLLSTLDGIAIDSLWAPGSEGSPVAILFHGNGSILDSMEGYAHWYRSKGFGVLLVTIRGYPGSGGDAIESGELGVFFDIEAAMHFVVNTQRVPINKVVAHGFSLGGAYAATIGRYFDPPVVLDHAFTNVEDIVVRVADWLPEFITRPAARDAFPAGVVTPISGARIPMKTAHFITDGMSNLEKVGHLESDLFVIFGSEDPMMPVEFAQGLLAAKFKDASKRAVRSVDIPGGHWGPFYKHADAEAKFEAFLRDNGLIAN